MIRIIEADKDKLMYYGKSGHNTSSSGVKAYNCLTWAQQKLFDSEIDISQVSGWSNFAPSPEWQTNGQVIIEPHELKENQPESQGGCRIQ